MGEQRKADPAPGLYSVAVAVMVVITGVLLLVPSFFLAIGLQAAGAAAGWWAGEPTTNDGEEVWATAVGGAACLVLLAGGVAGALALRRPFGVRTPVPAGLGFAVLGLGFTVAWLVVMS